ncbi:uncharacterized protein PHALS_03965 [Plasmopara halstedii]|uniref:Uncharacterized protein n=1 Tax=Plasmopara halstedii TaxID=4781 RepID=A0A0P1B0L5_PLAHL|nr:uncharacterized protein PHALS_03965 [Plasmopara halstedii]CEG47310.1 hypothetical protein PHALS_03965 [Plasmopara halstedii]|eukprot:XP_024583679.1 hypothetical protein PHALS_03965 [Plasmopara halstedii]
MEHFESFAHIELLQTEQDFSYSLAWKPKMLNLQTSKCFLGSQPHRQNFTFESMPSERCLCAASVLP